MTSERNDKLETTLSLSHRPLRLQGLESPPVRAGETSPESNRGHRGAAAVEGGSKSGREVAPVESD